MGRLVRYTPAASLSPPTSPILLSHFSATVVQMSSAAPYLVPDAGTPSPEENPHYIRITESQKIRVFVAFALKFLAVRAFL